MTKVEYIRYRVGQDRRDAFEAAYRQAAVSLAAPITASTTS
jgi:hypothetical protein